ncbi:hypothetical protein [Thalassospira indica]|nr:hypothetical protein [Thalassospira indica]
MSVISRLEELCEEVRGIEAKGQSVDAKALLKVLEDLIDQKAPDHDFKLAGYSHDLEHDRNVSVEMFRAIITSGQSAMRAAMLLNGGAAIAMLAFVGKLVELDVNAASHIANAILLFACGALAVAGAGSFTYVSQYFYQAVYIEPSKKHSWVQYCGVGFHAAAIVGVLTSYGLFGWGAWLTSAGVDLIRL